MKNKVFSAFLPVRLEVKADEIFDAYRTALEEHEELVRGLRRNALQPGDTVSRRAERACRRLGYAVEDAVAERYGRFADELDLSVRSELRATAVGRLEAILLDALRPAWMPKAVMEVLRPAGFFDGACKAVGIERPDRAPLDELWTALRGGIERVGQWLLQRSLDDLVAGYVPYVHPDEDNPAGGSTPRVREDGALVLEELAQPREAARFLALLAVAAAADGLDCHQTFSDYALLFATSAAETLAADPSVTLPERLPAKVGDDEVALATEDRFLAVAIGARFAPAFVKRLREVEPTLGCPSSEALTAVER